MINEKFSYLEYLIIRLIFEYVCVPEIDCGLSSSMSKTGIKIKDAYCNLKLTDTRRLIWECHFIFFSNAHLNQDSHYSWSMFVFFFHVFHTFSYDIKLGSIPNPACFTVHVQKIHSIETDLNECHILNCLLENIFLHDQCLIL